MRILSLTHFTLRHTHSLSLSVLFPKGNLGFVHGGPFANIAHGCSTVLATKAAMAMGDYVVTEGDFLFHVPLYYILCANPAHTMLTCSPS